MYSRQNRSRPTQVPIEIPRDYSGNAFMPFPEPTATPPRKRREERVPEHDVPLNVSEPPKERNIPDPSDELKDQNADSCQCDGAFGEPDGSKDHHEALDPCPVPSLNGLSKLFGGDFGLEELLLLGVIFLIFADNTHRDNELLICLLLILFI